MEPPKWITRMTNQPLWWWLGESRWSKADAELFGIEPRESTTLRERPARIWARFTNVRPRPFSAGRQFYQRGTRGWSDQDTWALDTYLAGWLPDAIEHIRDHSYSYPPDACGHPGAGVFGCDHCLADEGFEAWKAILTRMAECLRSGVRDIGELYVANSRVETLKRVEEAEANFQEGMDLLARWWFHLSS